ncbi:unnamed protein product, partial [Ectocarpus sp. 6 AP-2014]
MRISLLKRLGPALSISQVLDYLFGAGKTCTLHTREEKKKNCPQRHRTKNMPTAPSIPHRHLCSATIILLLMMHHFPLEPSSPSLLPAAAPSWAHTTFLSTRGHVARVRPALPYPCQSSY